MAVNKFRWQRKPEEVLAVYWSGTNKAEIEEFFSRIRYICPEDQGPYFKDDDDEDRGTPYFYNTIQFYIYDDHEVDEDRWLVISRFPDGDPRVEVMDTFPFHDEYERPTN